MGRPWYTAASYAAAVERIVRDAPVFGLGADIIAGFPGESAEDHCATLSLVESLPFTSLHVFPYSVRPGTAAERLGGQVSPGEIRERARALRELGERKADAYRRFRDGGVAELLIVGNAATRDGLTEDYIRARCADEHVTRGSRVMVRLQYAGGDMLAVPIARDY
jgi:threonylcarbamoyladenosine tRNA methylthiotransferase MtaB